MLRLQNHILNNIISSELREMLFSFLSAKNINENLLAICILIELKYSLLEESHHIDVINELKNKKLDINFKNYTEHRNIEMTIEYLEEFKPQYSRVVDKVTFDVYIGSFKFKSPIIDKYKIERNGWSSRNGIVWITPKEELDRVLMDATYKDYPANDVCDFLGFPREESDIKYIKIDYSLNFPEKIFQPNSSNRLWHYEYNLFIPYKQFDNFGRTFNQNGLEFAKEQVHSKSVYYDEHFEALDIGKSSAKYPVNDQIIELAVNRLEL